jgi:2-polyprenyl-3-methyl-5-hydroxy-6-metoxy-1,4-benzoquinol methylase
MTIDNKTNIKKWSSVPINTINEFGDEGDFARQYLLNPTLLRLLCSVKGKHIIDAGCGNGYLCRKLAKMGAQITGIEPAESLFQYAQSKEKKEPLGIKYIQADLSSYSDSSIRYDSVISNMVFMDIPDYEKAITNCINLLKNGGNFIFSISHPCFEGSSVEWKKMGFVSTKDYFKEYSTKQTFGHSFHRPLSKYINILTKNNCLVKKIVEPQLSKEVAKQHPNEEKDHYVPSFIVIHAIKSN